MLEPLTAADPSRIGPYTLAGRLGPGAVYLGHDPDGTAAAVRVVPASLVAEVRRRSAALGRVRGEHTVMLLDADLSAARPWLATEYVAGPSLREVVAERGSLPVPEVLRLVAGVAEGLAAIHAAGATHGHLTAGHVLLPPEGPRVVDYGMSAEAEEDLPALGRLITYLATAATGELPEPLGALTARCLAASAERPTAAEVVEYCRAELARSEPSAAGQPAESGEGDPLAYTGVSPPTNPLDLSAGIPGDSIVGPIPAPRAEEDTDDPLAYPATEPPANPLDLSTGIPGDSIVGPIAAGAMPDGPATPPPPSVDVVPGTPAGASTSTSLVTSPPSPRESTGGAAPSIDPEDLAALRAAADAVDAVAGAADLAAGATAPPAGTTALDVPSQEHHDHQDHTIEPVAYAEGRQERGRPWRIQGHTRRRLAALAAAVLFGAAVIVSLAQDDTTAGTPVAATDGATPAIEDVPTTVTTGPTCTGVKHLVAGGAAHLRAAVVTIAEQWAARCRGSTVDFTPGGSGFGVGQFAAGETDFAVADHALGANQGEIASVAARCAGPGAPADKDLVVQVPVVLTPVVLAYHLPGVAELRLDARVLSAIFGGRLTRWNDRTIAELNPGTRLPALAITPVARADPTLSTQTFQQYLAAAGGWRSGDGPEFTGKARMAHRSDADVLATVRTVEGAIGYLPHPATRPTEEPVASLVTGDGTAAVPGSDTVNSAVDAALDDTDDYTRLPDAIHRTGTEHLDGGTAPYPLVHVGYLIACTQYPHDRTTAAIRDFLLTALGMQVESVSGYQLPFGDLRTRLVDLVERTY